MSSFKFTRAARRLQMHSPRCARAMSAATHMMVRPHKGNRGISMKR